MTDAIDYQLTRKINTSYGIQIGTNGPTITGAVIPKIRVTNSFTTDLWVAGSVQTPLRLTQPLVSVTGDLILTSATGRVSFGGATLTNYTAAHQDSLTLSFQSTSPTAPAAGELRVYADGDGSLATKLPSGLTTTLDSSGLTASRVFTLPDADMTFAGVNLTQTLTNKTINSASNTILVGGTNINSLVDQDVRLGASPQFANPTITSNLLITTADQHAITVNQTSTPAANDLLFKKSGVNVFAVGTDESVLETYTWTHAARDYKIGTNNTERLRVASTGIANNNATTNILGLQGTTLVYKNNLLDTNTAQTLTNKVIDSASNTLQVSGTNVNTLIDQDVRMSAMPTFSVVNSTNGTTQFGGRVISYRGTTTTTTAATVTLITIPVATDSVMFLRTIMNAFGTAGSTANTSCGQRMLHRITNVAGTVTVSQISNQFQNAFATNLFPVASGSNVLIQITGIAANTIRWEAHAVAFIE